MRRSAAVFTGFLLLAAPAHALDVRVTDVRAASVTVQATIELRELIPDRFKQIIDDGGVLHVRVQTELWESRPVWDHLVYPVIVRMFRLARAAAGRDVALIDTDGLSIPVAGRPGADVPLVVDIGDRTRVTADNRYYVHVIATVGTLAEREVDEAGDAVFGRPTETNGLGSLGRLMFRTAMQVSGYLQSVSAETKSRRLLGREILH